MSASGDWTYTMAVGSMSAAEEDFLQALRARGDGEVTRLAMFTLQQSSERLSLLSSAATSSEIRDRLVWLSTQSAHTARSLAAPGDEAGIDNRPASPVGLFRRDVDHWTISYGGVIVRLKHTRGLEYLRHLIAHPGRECLALDLLARSRDGHVTGGRHASLENTPLPILDAASKAAYGRRLAALRELLQNGEDYDSIAAEQARAEIEFLQDELAAAVGLGGRNRRTGTSAERARSTATKGIKSAIAKIRAAYPYLGRHFEQSVRTGVYCTYAPDADDRPEWQF